MKYLEMIILTVHYKTVSIDTNIIGFVLNTAYGIKLGLNERTDVGYLI